MAEHFKSLSAVFPVILREADGVRRVLLHRRANTGYMDGLWDFSGSGHVDGGETAGEALCRECREELSIEAEPADLRFVHLCHRVCTGGLPTYYGLYFVVEKFVGNPVINEPHKCSGLAWFEVDRLPEGMIPLRRRVLGYILSGVPYSEMVEGGEIPAKK